MRDHERLAETTRDLRDYERPSETTRDHERLAETTRDLRDYERPLETTRPVKVIYSDLIVNYLYLYI